MIGNEILNETLNKVDLNLKHNESDDTAIISLVKFNNEINKYSIEYINRIRDDEKFKNYLRLNKRGRKEFNEIYDSYTKEHNTAFSRMEERLNSTLKGSNDTSKILNQLKELHPKKYHFVPTDKSHLGLSDSSLD